MTTTSSDKTSSASAPVTIERELHCAPLEYHKLDLMLNRWFSFPPLCLHRDHVARAKLTRELLLLARLREAQRLDTGRLEANSASAKAKSRHLERVMETSATLAQLCQRLRLFHGAN